LAITRRSRKHSIKWGGYSTFRHSSSLGRATFVFVLARLHHFELDVLFAILSPPFTNQTSTTIEMQFSLVAILAAFASSGLAAPTLFSRQDTCDIKSTLILPPIPYLSISI
jgi:TRAP-type C4-dicarboxylate transport system permease small subunit